MVFYASYAFGVIFFICKLGQRLTDAFGEIGVVIESFQWNLFSLEVQKLLIIILMVEQQPVYIECFGSTSGIRETFKKVRFTKVTIGKSFTSNKDYRSFIFQVTNSGFSYFMVICQFMK